MRSKGNTYWLDLQKMSKEKAKQMKDFWETKGKTVIIEGGEL